MISFLLVENKIDQTKNYLFVMEYADGGTLREYLKKNFDRLIWEDKYKLAYQLACSILCLHDEGIVHRDQHSEHPYFITILGSFADHLFDFVTLR